MIDKRRQYQRSILQKHVIQLTLRRQESVIRSYSLQECDVIRIFKLRGKPSSSVQFENNNDVTLSVINMNR